MANKKFKAPVKIPVEKIRPFEGHPYKVLDNDDMNTLIESIQNQGILSPVFIRPIENTDEYEVISGHRRIRAAIKGAVALRQPRFCVLSFFCCIGIPLEITLLY